MLIMAKEWVYKHLQHSLIHCSIYESVSNERCIPAVSKWTWKLHDHTVICEAVGEDVIIMVLT